MGVGDTHLASVNVPVRDIEGYVALPGNVKAVRVCLISRRASFSFFARDGGDILELVSARLK